MINAIIASVESDFFRNASFLSGVLVAMISIYSARAVTMKKQSSDLVFASRSDDDFNTGIACTRRMYESQNLRSLVQPSDDLIEDAKSVRYVLNYFEMLAIGIRNGIYDEGILKSNYWTTVINLQEQAQPYIVHTREIRKSDTLFQEFCWLSARWQRNPLKAKKTHWPYTLTR